MAEKQATPAPTVPTGKTKNKKKLDLSLFQDHATARLKVRTCGSRDAGRLRLGVDYGRPGSHATTTNHNDGATRSKVWVHDGGQGATLCAARPSIVWCMLRTRSGSRCALDQVHLAAWGLESACAY